MGIYGDQMFNLGGAAVTSLTAMNAGTSATAGNYLPQLNGRLMKIDIFITPQAATSLAQSGRVELLQTNWKPNTLRYPFAGFGLATAPQAIGGNELQVTYVVDQPVQTDWGITGTVIYLFSPVTPNIVVQGTFSG